MQSLCKQVSYYVVTNISVQWPLRVTKLHSGRCTQKLLAHHISQIFIIFVLIL